MLGVERSCIFRFLLYNVLELPQTGSANLLAWDAKEGMSIGSGVQSEVIHCRIY